MHGFVRQMGIGVTRIRDAVCRNDLLAVLNECTDTAIEWRWLIGCEFVMGRTVVGRSSSLGA